MGNRPDYYIVTARDTRQSLFVNLDKSKKAYTSLILCSIISNDIYLAGGSTYSLREQSLRPPSFIDHLKEDIYHV
jgi:hypothetical protein